MTVVRASSRPSWTQQSMLPLYSMELAKHLEVIGAYERQRTFGGRDITVTATHELGDGFVRLLLPRAGLSRWDAWMDGSLVPPADETGIAWGGPDRTSLVAIGAIPSLILRPLRQRPATD